MQKFASDLMGYLNVELHIVNNKITTRTYFKLVDTNSLLDFRSSHYKKWLLNVPYGQFR